MIALTIEVKNTPKQSIGILVDNSKQEIDVINIAEQKIGIAEQAGLQEIDVENALEQNVEFKQDIVMVTVYKDAPKYEGVYNVTPKVSEQTLPTAKKLLSKDVTIREIPYFEVGNNSGGNTVYIADALTAEARLGEAILGEVTL